MAGQAALGGPAGLSCAAAAAGCYAYYKYRLSPRFGGVSGDLAGWFLSVCECAMLAAAVLVQKGGGVAVILIIGPLAGGKRTFVKQTWGYRAYTTRLGERAPVFYGARRWPPGRRASTSWRSS